MSSPTQSHLHNSIQFNEFHLESHIKVINKIFHNVINILSCTYCRQDHLSFVQVSHMMTSLRLIFLEWWEVVAEPSLCFLCPVKKQQISFTNKSGSVNDLIGQTDMILKQTKKLTWSVLKDLFAADGLSGGTGGGVDFIPYEEDDTGFKS